MADIFISYAREDIERVRPIVKELEKLGWSVFWDTKIQPGDNWPVEITEALKSSRCVLVFWSLTSVDFQIHHWIREEAEAGRKKGILVPLLLDVVDLPIGFSHVQAADLSRWKKNSSAPEFQKLINAVTSKISSSAPPVITPTLEPEPEPVSKPAPVFSFNSERASTSKSPNPKTERQQKVTRNENSASKINPKLAATAVAVVIALMLLVVGLTGRKQVNIPAGSALTVQSIPAPQTTALKIGDEYGGGKIASIDAIGKHGLITANADLPGGDKYSWDDAKKACQNLAKNGYSDWYLPSEDDLNKLYLAKNTLDGFVDGYYWSSTEVDAGNAWYQNFGDGHRTYDVKGVKWRVRPVRAF